MGFPVLPQSVPPDEPEDINFIKEAFYLQYNWIALAGAVAFAVASGSSLPLVLAAGLELMYLAVVPQNARFRRLVRSRKLFEQQRRNHEKLSELLRSLPAEMQNRYIRSAQVASAIRSNFAQFSSISQIFLGQIDARLQGLLRGYARLLLAATQQQQYMKTTDASEIKRQMAAVERTLASDPPRVQEINRKRIEILTKRQEKFSKICENRRVLDAQLAAVEDVLMLVRDQSVTMRDPQQVSDRLESLVHDVEQTEQTVHEIETVFSEMAPDLESLMSLEESSRPSPAGRVRIPN